MRATNSCREFKIVKMSVKVLLLFFFFTFFPKLISLLFFFPDVLFLVNFYVINTSIRAYFKAQ